MNYAVELDKIIELASDRSDFTPQGYRPFEQEQTADLRQNLKKANLFFTCSVLGMEAVSHVIEDQATNVGGPFEFYSGFQKFSRIRPQEARYRRLVTLGNPIYLFGVPDVSVWEHPNLKKVLLAPPQHEEHNLAHNWFVVLNNPQFVSMALVARELPNATSRPVAAPNKLLYRNFEGFWTYDKDVITVVVDILQGYIKEHQPVAPI